MANHDASLVKFVYREERGGHLITACLTRFGGLAVFVRTADFVYSWQGENILAARDWVDAKIAREAA